MRPVCPSVLLSFLLAGCLESEGRSVSSTITIGTTLDADERYLSPAWDVSAHAVFRADPPVTYLYPEAHNVVAHRRIRGLSSPFRADIEMYMYELWIGEPER